MYVYRCGNRSPNRQDFFDFCVLLVVKSCYQETACMLSSNLSCLQVFAQSNANALLGCMLSEGLMDVFDESKSSLQNAC